MQRVRANRGAYLAGVFTIVGAFFAADAPEPTGPLIWLERADPWGGMEAMRTMDPAQEQILRLHNALREAFRTADERKHISTAECAKKADEATGARDEYGRLIFKYSAFRELTYMGGIAGGVEAPTYADLYSGAWKHPTFSRCLR
jgi:hypothetical protein